MLPFVRRHCCDCEINRLLFQSAGSLCHILIKMSIWSSENLFAIFTVVILHNVINDVIVGGVCGRCMVIGWNHWNSFTISIFFDMRINMLMSLKQLWNNPKTFQNCFSVLFQFYFTVWNKTETNCFVSVLFQFYFRCNHCLRSCRTVGTFKRHLETHLFRQS